MKKDVKVMVFEISRLKRPLADCNASDDRDTQIHLQSFDGHLSFFVQIPDCRLTPQNGSK